MNSYRSPEKKTSKPDASGRGRLAGLFFGLIMRHITSSRTAFELSRLLPQPQNHLPEKICRYRCSVRSGLVYDAAAAVGKPSHLRILSFPGPMPAPIGIFARDAPSGGRTIGPNENFSVSFGG
uniref:Uncharacterized protein n=1 Tax=Anopheles coluzzii TaxID=1518534 RepID=A0A8W7PNZ6_ANOCL